MAGSALHLHPAINPRDHGPQVVIAGGVMLASTLLMLAIAFYNRYNAKTMFYVDSPLILIGVSLNIVFFALYAVMVQHGFGHHEHTFTETQQHNLRQLFLGSTLVFFLANGVIKTSYNLLARRTARSKTYKLAIDGFSGFIGLWTISNIIVVAVSLANASSPNRIFFWVSGIISILIVLGQLFAFLFIILNTTTKWNIKLRWSLSMGAFVPLTVTAIILRLVFTPEDYFRPDWTFKDVLQGILFHIDLNLVTMTVLAPNLPVFFQKTSTGGVFFLPGEATGGSRSNTKVSNNHSATGNSYMMSSRVRKAAMENGSVYNGKDDIMTSITHGDDPVKAKRASFDSDVILMRRSVEVERTSDGEISQQTNRHGSQ